MKPMDMVRLIKACDKEMKVMGAKEQKGHMRYIFREGDCIPSKKTVI